MSFLNELNRRNVIRVATAYVVASWLIIQVVETIFPIYGLGDAAIRTVITLLAVMFIPALILSWVFELTPEGLKREVEVLQEDSITRYTGKKLDRIILMLAAIAIAYFAFDKFVLEPGRVAEIVEETAQQARSEALVDSYGDKSIAVLPFVNLSSDPEQEYFSDGISEELLNLLARIPELRVISRSSAFSFKGKDIPIPEVAKQLHVGHVLEGSIRKAGDRVRITAQLIEARSDTHLWSAVYDRGLGDIFAIQEEIAGAIEQALALKLALGTDDAAMPAVVNPASADTYDIYLQGRELVRLRDPDSLEQATRLFERALRLDANFAPAHAQLAIAAMHKVQVGASTVEDARLFAAPHLERARELEPGLADVYYGQALLASLQYDPESAIDNSREALSINPSYSDAWTVQANSLNRLGRYADADAAYQQVLDTDPLNPIGLSNYIERLDFTGQTEKAHKLADLLLTQSPGLGYSLHALTSMLYEGKIAEGLEWALKGGKYVLVAICFRWIGESAEAYRLDPSNDIALGSEEAIRETQRALNRDPDNVGAITEAAIALYSSNRIDEALPLLERALDLGPDNRPIRSHLDLYLTMMLAEARRITGDEAGAQAVAEIVRQDYAARVTAGQQHENLDVWGALIAAFDGDRDGAIALLRSAVQHGLRAKDEIFNELIFEPLWDDPRYIELQAELDAILAEEHEKVLQLICFNNPVPDDWRPLPETCEGVENGTDPK